MFKFFHRNISKTEDGKYDTDIRIHISLAEENFQKLIKVPRNNPPKKNDCNVI